MKKQLIGVLASLGCLACFAGCGGNKELEQAKDYVQELYKNVSAETNADYTRAGFVKINGVDYSIVWTVNVTEGVTVTTNEDGDYVIDVNENTETAIPYVLTATISDAKGNKETLTYNYTVPKFTELTWQQFTAAEDDTAVVIKGVIGGIVNTSSKHELYLQDDDGGYYVYNLAAEKMEGLQIGQEIRVRGTRDTYYGVNQVVEADVEVLNATPVDVVAQDITETFKNAADLKDESLYALQSKLIVIKGATVLGQDASDSSYYNFKLGNKKSYVRISSSACMFGSEDQKAFKDAVAANKGKVADVTGFISIYNNNVYIIPQTKDAFSNFQILNLTDAEKIDFEIDLMQGVADKIPATVALQTKGSIYETVTIAWESSNTAVAKVENGKLVVTRPAMDAADAEVTLTATVSCGAATAKTVTYTVTIPKLPSTVPQAITAAPVVDTTYKMYMEQTKAGKTVYALGAMDGYYIATSEAQEEAVDVTVKQGSAAGKFYLFFDGAGYLTITYKEKSEGSGTYYKNISFTRDAATDFVWDDANKTLVNDTTEDAKKCFLGTRNDKPYTTIGTCDYSYIGTNFIAKLCTLVPATQGDGNQGGNQSGTVGAPATDGLQEGVAYIVTANNANGPLYLKGTITSGRFDCSTNVADAVRVYVQNVTGGQLLYMLNGTEKVYFVFGDKAAGGSTTTDASVATVFEWNATLHTLVVADDENNRAFGSDTSKTYTNFSSYDASNTTYSYGQFCPVN